MASVADKAIGPQERRVPAIVWVVGVPTVTFVAVVGLGLLVGALLVWFGPLSNLTGVANQSLTTADLTGAAVAGGTMLLAAGTGVLAMFTLASVFTAQQEVVNTERALQFAGQQVEATNTQNEIAQDTLRASWRPLLAEIPQGGTSLRDNVTQYIRVRITPSPQGFEFYVGLMNIGRGPAFIVQALLGLGSAIREANGIQPKILAPGDVVVLRFKLHPPGDALDKSLSIALGASQELSVGVSYHDIGAQRAWRSNGKLRYFDDQHWMVRDVVISEAKLVIGENPHSVSIQ
jgi:hypothetical protein